MNNNSHLARIVGDTFLACHEFCGNRIVEFWMRLHKVHDLMAPLKHLNVMNDHIIQSNHLLKLCLNDLATSA